MLEIRDLSLSFGGKIILDSISFTSPQKNIGIIGQSGSGKSSLLKSLVALFSSEYVLRAKALRVCGEDVLSLEPKYLRDLRRRVSYVSADIYGSFYPLSDIGSVFEEILSYHSIFSKKTRKKQSFEMMERLGLKNLDVIWHSYIRELSGGMARRVQLALSLLCGAEYLLCDELTSSLDYDNAKKILQTLKELKLPIIAVTHDPNLISELCDDVLVISDGKIEAVAPVESFFVSPQGAYAKTFVEAYQCLR